MLRSRTHVCCCWSSVPDAPAAHEVQHEPNASTAVSCASNDGSSGGLFAPPPSTCTAQRQLPVAPVDVVVAPTLARIDELLPAETCAAAAVNGEQADEEEQPLPLPDYDRMFCPSEPEYVEYRQAWHRAQEEFSSPATPRSLLSPVAVALDDGEACTALDLLVASSRPRTPAGARTPKSRSQSVKRPPRDHAIIAVDAGALVIPPQVKAAAIKADTFAAQQNANLVPASSSSMDWAAVSASLHQWQVASAEPHS